MLNVFEYDLFSNVDQFLYLHNDLPLLDGFMRKYAYPRVIKNNNKNKTTSTNIR